MTISHTVFFTQYQGDQPDFSDGLANPELHRTLEAGLAAFKADHGHRRLLAISTDFFSGEAQGNALELMRV